VQLLPAVVETSTPETETETMTANAGLPLKFGLTARYLTKAELARLRRAEARRKAKQDNADQLPFD
jgi:hypothetical protein